MATITIRELPDDLQDFLKADAAANHRSVNKQVIVALDEYRRMRQPKVNANETQQDKVSAIQKLLDAAKHKIVVDPRTDNEILGYNEHGSFR